MKMWILLAALASAASGDEAPSPKSVAFTFQVEGKVRVTGPSPAAVEPWRYLVPGEVLETAEGASVSAVYFGSGRIYRLEPESRAQVGPGGLVARQGTVRLVKELPEKVDLKPLLGPKARRRPGAGTLRGEEGEEIPQVPAEEAAICLPQGRGKVEILDERERVIYEAEAALRIPIPAGVLRPGQDYSFRVGGKEGLFTTLERRQGKARAALKKEAAKDPDLLELLARVDEELGVRECLGP